MKRSKENLSNVKSQMSNAKGFTLIELLVVIGIIGVISAIGVSTYGGIREKAQDSVRKNDLQTLATALELYYQKNSNYIIRDSTDSSNCLDFNQEPYKTAIHPYISGDIIPKDPNTNNPYCYQPNLTGSLYTLTATLGNQTSYTIDQEGSIAVATPTATPTPTPTPTPAATSTPSPTTTPTPIIIVKRVFTTSGPGYTGSLGGLDGADQQCLNKANAANLCGASPCPAHSWKAWLSDSSQSPSTRFTNTTEYRQQAKFVLASNPTAIIADNWTDLTDSSLYLPINKTETGGTPTYICNMTNTNPNGSIISTSLTCNNWTDASSTLNRRGGSNTGTASDWTYSCLGSCGLSRPLYCFEQ